MVRTMLHTLTSTTLRCCIAYRWAGRCVVEISSVSGVVTPMKQNGPRLLDITGGSTFEARSALCWWVHKGHRWTDGVTNSASLLCTTETPHLGANGCMCEFDSRSDEIARLHSAHSGFDSRMRAVSPKLRLQSRLILLCVYSRHDF